MEPYFDESDGIVYVADLVINMILETAFDHTSYISSNVTNITKVNGSRADMTIMLTIKPFSVINGTNITCQLETSAIGTLFLAGIYIVFIESYILLLNFPIYLGLPYPSGKKVKRSCISQQY